ncbi:MAG: carboxypeptidase regulatory-like domain-containing protein [Chloroflexi bacterium]|nr:carboxypeptidase regulatory-like domain-containing protein [Chloroflexota bacterium]
MSKQCFFWSRRIWLMSLLAAGAALALLGLRPGLVAAQTAPPPGYCDDSKHDPTRWHPAVEPVTGCMYGHEHGSDPNPSGSLFAPVVFGGDEATPNENVIKHNGYKIFYIHRSNTQNANPTSDPCDDVRVRVHMDVTPRERTGQYHSFEAAIAHCANGQRDVSYIQGWMDFGTVVSLSTREGGDPGIRPMKFAPSPNDFAANGLNIWEVWYGRSGVGLDMGWLVGEVPTLFHDGSDPQNPATWNWTGGEGRKRKMENFNFYGFRETRRGEFWTDQFGNSVDPNSTFCKDPNNKCLRQYVSRLFGTSRSDIITFNLAYNNEYDTRGVNFPDTFPVDGAHLPWWNGQPSQPTPTQTSVPPTVPPTTMPPTATPTVNPTEPTVRIEVNPASATTGATVQVAVNLLNVVDLFGVQAKCTVNPQVLSGTQSTDGDVFTQANSLFVNTGFNAADGSWLIAASRRLPNPPFTGSGIAFKLNYTIKGAGSSPVDCSIMGVDSNGQEKPLKVMNGTFNGAPQTPPTATSVPPTATPIPPTATTVAPTATTPAPVQLGTITGVVQYQNRPDNAGITVQLRDTSLTVLAEVVTGANGAFSFTDVPVGTYSLKAVAPFHLDWVTPVTVESAGQTVTLEPYTCQAGDTNDDNIVNLTDAGLIGANFGLQAPPAPAGANLNGDTTVDVRDLALVGSNYELTGPAANE